jgi:hypothetical protein
VEGDLYSETQAAASYPICASLLSAQVFCRSQPRPIPQARTSHSRASRDQRIRFIASAGGCHRRTPPLPKAERYSKRRAVRKRTQPGFRVACQRPVYERRREVLVRDGAAGVPSASALSGYAPVVKRTSRRSPEPQVRVRFPAGAYRELSDQPHFPTPRPTPNGSWHGSATPWRSRSAHRPRSLTPKGLGKDAQYRHIVATS